MKTVFLFLRLGISNRNLLRTDFLKTLRETPDVRTVIISSIGDEPEFRKEFEAPNVCVEKWPRTRVSFWERRLKNLKDYVWVSRGLTQAIRVRRLAQRGRWGLAWRDAVGRLAAQVGITEDWINRVELEIYRGQRSVCELYNRYKPDLVMFTRLFSTNLHVIKEAKKRGIPVLCLVESWDNFISKGPLSVVPDRMAVWNGDMIDEAHDLHSFPRDKVEMVGVPQFDIYAAPDRFMKREEFFAALGLDPKLKLVTYAASTEGIARNEPGIVDLVYQAIASNKLAQPAQLLVRLHPITSPELRQEYHRRFDGLPRVAIQYPGRLSSLHDGWDPSLSDMNMLGATIWHSDVIVNVASTMTIDAAALDKPIICVGFEQDAEGVHTEHLKGIFYHSHYRKLVDTHAFELVFNASELVRALDQCLVEPSLNAAGRECLRQRFCYRLDGHSARRTASLVLRDIGIAVSENKPLAKITHTTRTPQDTL